MSLPATEIHKIGHLARLALNDELIPKYAQELTTILELVAQMDSVDTSNITPMAHPLHASQRLRPDVVTEKDQRELFQSIAPAAQAGLYLVPKVIE
jgi:aspartyl-tRNA(Asn)/glutamyl-tRNA(Gln) amidotransferase subunit C